MMMSEKITRLIVLGFLAFALMGCGGESEAERDETARIVKLETMRANLKFAFVLGALGYLCVGLIGPKVAEGSRALVANRFQLSTGKQVLFAKCIYWTVVIVVLIASLVNVHLKEIEMAVWLLLAGTAYPFFVDLLPSLESGDKTRRKAALGLIKSFLMLIVVFFVVLKFLDPDGFAGLKIQ